MEWEKILQTTCLIRDCNPKYINRNSYDSTVKKNLITQFKNGKKNPQIAICPKNAYKQITAI